MKTINTHLPHLKYVFSDNTISIYNSLSARTNLKGYCAIICIPFVIAYVFFLPENCILILSNIKKILKRNITDKKKKKTKASRCKHFKDTFNYHLLSPIAILEKKNKRTSIKKLLFILLAPIISSPIAYSITKRVHNNIPKVALEITLA